jgi:Lipopolysaccharide-assembly
MPVTKKIFFFLTLCTICSIAFFNSSCGIYKFKDVSFPDSIKTFKVNPIENRATYVNTQLSPQLTDKLRRKIISQTKLKQTNGDNPDWEISGTITDYSFSTSGISNQQTASNRLNVTVHIIRSDLKSGDSKEYNVTRNFDFPASQSLQQAESSLLNDMIRGLSDDIFNQLFSTW